MQNKTLVEFLLKKYDVDKINQLRIKRDLMILARKDRQTYLHSIRVTFLAIEIAQALGLDPLPLLYSAPRHDIGKKELPKSLLKKKSFTKEDMGQMQSHPIESFKHTAPTNLFSGLIIVRHHKFNPEPYPKKIPASPIKVSKRTLKLANEYAKVLAIADWWESALYRKNLRFSGKEITLEFLKENLLKERPKLSKMIGELFEKGFFTESMVKTANVTKKGFAPGFKAKTIGVKQIPRMRPRRKR
jgi:HD-GYP domain-containing protein (c-di-GMP phosphodiesterase class II)